MGKISLVLVVLLIIGCKAKKNQIAKCDCNKVINEFTYIESIYEMAVLCPEYCLIYSNGWQSSPKLIKFVDYVRQSTGVNFGNSGNDSCHTISDIDIDNVKVWLQKNCSKQYQSSYQTEVKKINYQLRCLELTTIDLRLSNENYKTIRSDAGGFIKNKSYMQADSAIRFLYEIDEVVLFNSILDKALIFVNKKDTTNHSESNFTDILFASKELNKWQFYLFKKDIKLEMVPTPLVRQDLQSSVFKNLIEEGYFIRGTCRINNNYLDSIYVQLTK